MLDRIVNTLFNTKTKQLNLIESEIMPVLNNKHGVYNILDSILSMEFPLVISESLFKINSGQIERCTHLSAERKKFFLDLIRNGVDENSDKEYLKYYYSADIPKLNKNDIIFHTHPRYTKEEYNNSTSGKFSRADLRLSKLVPSGLLEYCLMDEGLNSKPIKILGRLSLAHEGKTKKLSELTVELNQDGTFHYQNSSITAKGIVPMLGVISPKLASLISECALLDSMKEYVLEHAIYKDHENKS